MTKLFILTAAAGFIASTSAVTTTIYANVNCQNAYGSCTNIAQGICCKDTFNGFGFDSASITPLQYFDIGIVYSVSGSKKCGTIRDSQNGPVTCLSYSGGLDGAAWYDCTTCTTNSKKRGDFEMPPQFAPGQEGNCTGTVAPDKLTFVDGHQFEIGSSTPANVTTLLYRYAMRQSTVEDLPEELLAYEVNTEGVQERAVDIASRKV